MARRPAGRSLALEASRAASEFLSFSTSRRVLRQAPRGDGHPVLVLPGLLGGDGSTLAMRRFLRGLGYYVHAWRLGRNWGPTDRILDGLRDRFRSLYDHHGRRVSLVGHSLGGIYARELARRAPDAVRQVITLGSPVRFGRGSSNAEPVYRSLSALHSERAKSPSPRDLRHEALRVPLTAVFTRTDGVVQWRSCLVERASQTECVEVPGSHSGLIHNPAALLVVADRLALPEGEWVPFVEREALRARVWDGAGDR